MKNMREARSPILDWAREAGSHRRRESLAEGTPMLLEGLKVIEWATWVAAPACSAVMADWGADVVKIESPEGDAVRAFYPDNAKSPGNPVFTLENRGKRSVVLDLASEAGRGGLLRLLESADVFLTNVRPGALKRAQLDYDSLKDRFPRLIMANVTGYGLSGPLADQAAFDITAFWARSGVARAFIPTDQRPFSSRPGFGDHFTAMSALAGILAAAHERARTGRGRHVETALLRVGAYGIGWDLSEQLRYGAVTTAQPRDDTMVPLNGFFRTGDDRWLAILVRRPIEYPPLLRALGRADLADDARWLPPYADIATVRHVRGALDEAFAALTLAEAAERLDGLDSVWAPMESLADLEASPQAHEAGCFVEVPDGWGGGFLSPAGPVRFPGLDISPRAAAPKLGEHTRQVLSQAGFTPAEIEAMAVALAPAPQRNPDQPPS
jgi:crotonobetainyl-CoA:carnitine CoA-transferase CaiB-like acyl-CoA transferase